MSKTHRDSAELLSSKDFRKLVEPKIIATFETWIDRSGSIDPTLVQLLENMQIFIGRGGRRMRPYLTYLAYAGMGGTATDDVLDVAVAQEFYHNAWLIHDDIIDRDTKRYGGPNISGAYLELLNNGGDREASENRHLADSVSMIAGNMNMAIAADLILKSNFSAEIKLSATTLQQELIVELASGELLDILVPTLPESEISPDRLLTVSEYKTATYSFQTPLQIGAILAGADQSDIQAILPFARATGIAFQLSDDVLGIFGQDELTGKPNLSDLREGKFTLLIYETLHRASEADLQTLRNILGNSQATSDDLLTAQRIISESGGLEATNLKIRENIQLALDSLEKTAFRSDVKTVLSELVAQLDGRTS